MMTSASSSAGDRVLERMQACLAAKEYYAALQLTRSYWNRKKASAFDDAVAVALRSAKLFANYEQYAPAAEAACLCVDSWREKAQPIDETKLADVREINGLMSPCAEQLKFLAACISWSKAVGARHGFPEFRYLAGLSAWAQGDLAAACKHLTHSGRPDKFADMMFEWSTSAYASERDLFLTRGVLMLLASGNLKDANTYRDAFIAQCPASTAPPSPLTNFRAALPLLQLLRSKYKAHLSRDPSFDPYLQEIARVFYKFEPPKNFMDSMMSMFTPVMKA